MYKEPHERDLRKGRFSEPNRIYLVTTTTHARRPVFSDFSLGRIVVQSFRYHAIHSHADTLAYVVMPNHVHWLVSLGTTTSLSQLVASTKRFSSRRINLLRDRVGRRLWQSGFHDHAVRREEEVRQLARYVVANPLRAGLVKRLGDYPLWDATWV